jgi:TrmH family RNA methyltransferase
VTSTKNPAVQRFRDAASGASNRLMLAEGARLVREALDAGLTVVEAAVSPRLMDDELRQRLQREAATFSECSDAVLARLSALDTPQGLAVLLERPGTSLDGLLASDRTPLIVVAAGIRDPGNLGAVVRTAEAAGASGCLSLRGGADPFRDKAVRGSRGSIFRLPVCHGIDAVEAIDFVRRNRLQLVVADGAGERPYTDADLRRPLALVVGAEAAGVPPQWLAGRRGRACPGHPAQAGTVFVLSGSPGQARR